MSQSFFEKHEKTLTKAMQEGRIVDETKQPRNTEEGWIYESEIEALSEVEYERLEGAIDKAQRDNRILPGSPPVNSEEGFISQSQIERMSPEEYEASEGWIEKADRDGRILED